MKKFIALLLILLLTVSLASCGDTDNSTEPSHDSTAPSNNSTVPQDQNTTDPDEFKPISLGGTLITLVPDAADASAVTPEQMEIMKAFVESVLENFEIIGKYTVALDAGTQQITVRSDDVFTDEALDALTAVPELTFRNDIGEVVLNASHIQSAIAGCQQLSEELEAVVQIRFTDEGAELFRELTEKNIGKQISIYLDESLLSAPKVNAAIDNGEALISGLDTFEEAEKTANLINAGTLPFGLRIASIEGNEHPVQYTLSELEITPRTVLFKDTLGWADGEGSIYIFCYNISYYNYSPLSGIKKMRLLQDNIFYYKVPSDIDCIAFSSHDDFQSEEEDQKTTMFTFFDGSIHDYQPVAGMNTDGIHELTSWCGVGIDKYTDYIYLFSDEDIVMDGKLDEKCSADDVVMNQSKCITEFAKEDYPDSISFVIKNNTDQRIEDILLLITAYDPDGERTLILHDFAVSDVIFLRSFDAGAEPGATVTLEIPCNLSSVSPTGVKCKVIGYTSGGVRYSAEEDEITEWYEQQQDALPEYLK